MFELIQSFDNLFLHGVQSFFGGTQAVFLLIAVLGHPAFWFAIAALLHWNGKENKSFWMVNVLVFVSVVTGALKAFLVRPRPDAAVFQVVPENAWTAKLGESAWSFPSGHATTITGVLLFYYSEIKKTVKKSPLFLVLLVIASVSLSRLVLGLHFLSDVIGGIIIGALVGWATLQTHLRLEKKGFKLSKLGDELGFVFTLLLAVILMVWINPPLLTAGVLGYYAGFFALHETGFSQSRQNPFGQIKKNALGLFTTGVLGLSGILASDSMVQFAVFFGVGLWISAVYPWLFERGMAAK